MKTTELDLDKIRMDGGTQPRVELSEDLVAEYATMMEGGATFPPVVVFYDGTDYWLADGFHRAMSHDKLDRTTIAADVRQGTQRDAVLFSVGANSTHGQRRTNDDKRRSVMTLLNDEEWHQWSDNEIARRCGVSNWTVAKYRPESIYKSLIDAPAARKTTRGGTTYQQNTANIGSHRVKNETPLGPVGNQIMSKAEYEAQDDGAVVDTETGEEVGVNRERAKGKGIALAYDAINVLKRIPPDDPQRKDGLQRVAQWIETNA